MQSCEKLSVPHDSVACRTAYNPPHPLKCGLTDAPHRQQWSQDAAYQSWRQTGCRKWGCRRAACSPPYFVCVKFFFAALFYFNVGLRGICLCTTFLSFYYRISTGFRSGFWLGQCKTLIWLFFPPSPFSCWTDGLRCDSRILWYAEEFTVNKPKPSHLHHYDDSYYEVFLHWNLYWNQRVSWSHVAVLWKSCLSLSSTTRWHWRTPSISQWRHRHLIQFIM